VGGDGPTDPGGEAVLSLTLQPALIPSPANGSALPISRIRTVVTRASDGALLREQRFDVSPTATSWPLDVEVPAGGASVDVVLYIYLLNVATDGTEAVQFSGRSPTISVTAGATITGVDVDIVRGSLANLSVTGVTITAAPSTLLIGGTGTVSATATASPATVVPQVFFTSLDPAVLVMADSVATGVAAGTAAVVASAGSFADTVSILVVSPAVDSVRVSPDSADVQVGQTRTYTHTLYDQVGNVLTGPVSWSTGNPVVATVNGAGVVTGVAPGTTTVRATSGTVFDEAIVRVTAAPPSGPVIAGWDAARGGIFSLASGSSMSQARTSAAAAFPTATITGVNTLSSATLANVDALVISTAFDNVTAISALTTAEQNALLAFVLAGGCVVLLPENDANAGFPPVNQGLVAPFGMTVGGAFLGGQTTATVTSPSATTLTNGRFGLVSTFQQNFPGAVTGLGPNGSVLATNTVGNALAVIYQGALGTGSGPVIVFPDTQFDNVVLAANDVLWRNLLDACLSVGLPAPSQSGPAITWTRSGGGNWSDATAWSLARAPLPGDTVYLTQGVDYTVMLDVDASVAKVVIGGTSDVINLALGSRTLTITGTGTGPELDIRSLGRVDIDNSGALIAQDIVNAGTIVASGDGEIQARTIDNTDDIRVVSDVLLLVNSGTTLDFRTSGTVTIESGGGLVLGPNSYLTYEGGTFGSVNDSGVLFMSGNSELILDADLTIDGVGLLLGDADISTNTNERLVIGPNSVVEVVSSATTVFVEPKVLVQGNLFVTGPQTTFLDSLRIVASGSLAAVADSIDVIRTTGVENSGAIYLSGDVTFGPGSAAGLGITNRASGQIQIAQLNTQAVLNGELVNEGTLWVAGPTTLRRTDPSGATHVAAQHVNSGTVQLLGGATLNIVLGGSAPTFTNSGTIVVDAGTTLSATNLSDGQIIATSSAILRGAGTVDVQTGTPTGINNGVINPGVSGGTGILTWLGSVPMGPTGSITTKLFGTTLGSEYDRLNVSGTLFLDGTLNVLAGFAPANGDRFAVLTYGSRTGSFDQVNLPTNLGVTLDTLWVNTASTSVPDTLVIVASGGQPASWNAATDFSATANPNGAWSAGWTATLGSAFTTYPTAQAFPGFDGWIDPAIESLGTPSFAKNISGGVNQGVLPNQVTLHSGCQANQYSVLRWTAPTSGSYRVEVQFFVGNTGNTDAAVLVNGVAIYTVASTNSDPAYSSVRTLTAGDNLDFAVGTGGDTCSADATPLNVTITETTTPPLNLNAWVTNQSGNWSTAANWSKGSVPSASDSVVIGVVGTYTVTLDQNATVTNLMLGGTSGVQTLTGTSRTMTLNGPSVVGGNGSLSLTTSSVNGTGSLSNQGVALLTGTNVSTSVANSGQFTVRRDMSLTGALTTATGSTLRIEGAGGFNAVLTVSAGFTNNGTILLTDVTGFGAQLVVTTGTLVNATAGTIQAASGGGGARTLTASLDNRGTVTVNRFLTMDASGATHVNSGTVSLTSAQLSLGLLGGGSWTNTSTGVVFMASDWIVTGGTLNLTAGTVSASGLLTYSNGTLNYAAASLPGRLSLTNVTVTGGLTVPAAGSLTLESSSFASDVTVQSTGTLLIRRSVTLAGALTTPGTLRVEGQGGFTGSLTVTNGWTHTGAIELTDQSGFTSTLTVTNGTLVNQGTITALLGGNGARAITAPVDNQGTITISRSMGLTGTLTQQNALTVAAGQTLSISGALTLGSSSVSTVAGTLTHGGCTAQGGATFSGFSCP